MKTIIVATDFSDTAFNAAKYAAALTWQMPVSKMILYHSYYNMIIADPSFTDTQFYSQLQEDGIQRLKQISAQLKPLAADGIVIECVTDMASLREGVHGNFLNENAELVVMGVTGKSKLEETIMGSQAIIAARRTAVPLLLVPAESKYKKIGKVVFAWDMQDSEATFPHMTFKNILDALKAELLVLNIDYNNKNFDANIIREQTIMHQLLDPEGAKYFYGSHPDASRGIIAFAARYRADLVIIIPKKKSFPDSLFKKSTTKSVVSHINTPLLILPAVKGSRE